MKQSSFIKKQVRRVCRNYIIVAILAIAAIVFFLSNGPSPVNLLIKPETGANSRHFEQLYAQKRNFVSFTLPELYYTGYDFTEDGAVKSKYYIYFDGDKYVLCKMPKEFDQDEYQNIELSGVIEKLTNLDEQVVDGLAHELSEVEDYGLDKDQALEMFATMRIDFNRSVLSMRIFTVAGILGIGLLIFRIFRLIYFMFEYKSHKIYKRLGENGEHQAEKTDETITQELELEPIIKKNDLTVTKTWVTKRATFDLTVKPTGTLVWAYRTETKHYTNGIPSGKTYTISLCFSDGKAIDVSMKNMADAESFLSDLAAKMPWVLLGFTADWKAAFTTDVNKFLRMREQIMEQRGVDMCKS